MNFDDFTGQVQSRLQHPSTGEALRSIRATLTTLGERLQEDEASDLAAPLPVEIDRYVLDAESGQRFDRDEFVSRVWEREGMTDPNDRADAAYHAQVVVDVLSDCVPPGELSDVRDQLPADEDWDALFELVDADVASE